MQSSRGSQVQQVLMTMSRTVLGLCESYLPAEKVEGLQTLVSELRDSKVHKLSVDFVTRHSKTLLWPRSLLQAAGICAVASATVSGVAATICAGLVSLAVVGGLVMGVVAAALVVGGFVGSGAFVAALCISCGAALTALSAIGVGFSLATAWKCWDAAVRSTSFLVMASKVPAPVASAPVIDLEMKGLQTSGPDEGVSGEVTPRLYNGSTGSYEGQVVKSVNDLNAELAFPKPDAEHVDTPAGKMKTVWPAPADETAKFSPPSSVTSVTSSPLHLSGVRSEATADSDVATPTGSAQSMQSAPPAAAPPANRRGKKIRNRGGKKAAAPLSQEEVVDLLETRFHG